MAGQNLQINSLYNVNVYVDGVSYLGRCEEVDVPFPKSTPGDYKGLGMAGEAELPMGFGKLEGRIKWKSFDAQVMSLVVNPFAFHMFQFRGSVDQITAFGRAAQLPVVLLLTGWIKDPDKLQFKHQAAVENTSTLAIQHSELTIGALQIFMYDVFANVFTVNGVDQLAQFNANLGA